MILFIFHELVSCFGASAKLFISRQYRRVAAPRVWVIYLHSLLYGSGFTGRISNRDTLWAINFRQLTLSICFQNLIFPSFRI